MTRKKSGGGHKGNKTPPSCWKPLASHTLPHPPPVSFKKRIISESKYRTKQSYESRTLCRLTEKRVHFSYTFKRVSLSSPGRPLSTCFVVNFHRTFRQKEKYYHPKDVSEPSPCLYLSIVLSECQITSYPHA